MGMHARNMLAHELQFACTYSAPVVQRALHEDCTRSLHTCNSHVETDTWVIPGEINKEFRLTFRISTKFGMLEVITPYQILASYVWIFPTYTQK